VAAISRRAFLAGAGAAALGSSRATRGAEPTRFGENPLKLGSDRDGLAAKGHQLDIREVRGVGSVKGIMIHPRSGALMGGVSPTGDSYVMAW